MIEKIYPSDIKLEFSESISKKIEADELDLKSEKENEIFLKKMKKKGFFKRLIQFNKPYAFIILGLISSGI